MTGPAADGRWQAGRLAVIEKVADPDGVISVLRDRKNGAVIYAQGDYWQSEGDSRGVSLSSYIHAPHSLVAQSGARSALLIGCGGGTLATMLHAEGVAVTMVDVNPNAFAIAKRHFSLPGEVLCEVACGNAFLETPGPAYDAIVLDAFQGDRIPGQFMSTDFHRLAAGRLTPGTGCLFANVFTHHDLDPTPDLMASLMRKAFEDVRLLDERGSIDRNAIAMAGAVKGLARPSMRQAPETGVAQILADLGKLTFRPWKAMKTG